MDNIQLDYAFIQKLKSLPYVAHLYVYGSRARGDHQLRSDLDLAVDCPQASNQDWQEILEIIEDADTLLKIDVIRFDQLMDGALKKNINRDKKEIV